MTSRHRAVLYDELASAGFTSRCALEHLEILPRLLSHTGMPPSPRGVARAHVGPRPLVPGFSEPDAGSDLISLRTTATRDGDSYILQGRKMWTSWASYAQRCVVLARTGDVAERHHGLSVFFVDLETDGIEVRALSQANGVDELAEVTFDEVRDPSSERLWGARRACTSRSMPGLERWHVAPGSPGSPPGSPTSWPARRKRTAQSNSAMCSSIFALRMCSASAVERLADGQFLGPQAAPAKLLLTDAEQHLYDLARRVLGIDFAMGTTAAMADWQEEYLFSRATSIYGGTREMQLTTIARFLLDLPTAARP